MNYFCKIEYYFLLDVSQITFSYIFLEGRTPKLESTFPVKVGFDLHIL